MFKNIEGILRKVASFFIVPYVPRFPQNSGSGIRCFLTLDPGAGSVIWDGKIPDPDLG
jgi:hypothetical protein